MKELIFNSAGNSSLNESVYGRIVDAIGRSEFAPGQVLTEVGLSKWLGVSRTPVREALQRLKAEGLVRSFAGKGVIVAEVAMEDLMEICELRQFLEPPLYRKAATNMSSRHREELTAVTARMLAAAREGRREDWLEHDKVYHALVLGAADNRLATKILSDRRPQVRRVVQNAAILPERLLQCTLEHEEVAGCIVRGDGDGAAVAMRRHLESTTEHLMKVAYMRNLGRREEA